MNKLKRVLSALLYSPKSWYALFYVKQGKFIEAHVWFRERLHSFHIGVDTLFWQSEDNLAICIAEHLTDGTFVTERESA